MRKMGRLGIALTIVVGLGLPLGVGCRGKQTAQVMDPSQESMVGSHTAGAETYLPLVDTAMNNLLTKHSQGVTPAAFQPGSSGPMRICFVGVENRSAEEMGDFKDQLYQRIDTQIVQSQVYQPISRRFVEAGLREARLRPDELMIPQSRQAFIDIMQQQGQSFDYLLYATVTSGTTRENKDYQRNYLLTLEMVNIRTGQYDKETAELRKGYNRSIGAKVKNFSLF